MSENASSALSDRPAHDLRRRCSQIALGLALVMLAATFLLISPTPGGTFPGAIPWSDLSVLHSIIELMSLGGIVSTARGAEIKDFALHLAAAAGLLVLAWRQILPAGNPTATPDRGSILEAEALFAARTAGYAQVLLAGWVGLSLASSLWSGAPGMSAGQGCLYALSLGWAVAIAHTLDRRDIPRLLAGLVAISAITGLLCVWYYHERNPNHRPGFPLGNPNLVGAAMVPAILIAAMHLLTTATESLRTCKLVGGWAAIGSAAALVPLVWCFRLAGARGALVALLAGVVVMVVLRIRQRLRWVLAAAFLMLAVGAGVWWYYTSHLEVTMARGATLRFRAYAWAYAVQFWQAQPVLGSGAGCYPRLAGPLAVSDRALDPAAFMGELVEHAHNELFEVLAEIGLVGGVTFVGGLLATFAAGIAAYRATKHGQPPHSEPGQSWPGLGMAKDAQSLTPFPLPEDSPSSPWGGQLARPNVSILNPQPPTLPRWQLLALIGSVAALVADAMVGVNWRLPGGAAIFFTLLGTLWAAARSAPDNEADTAKPDRRIAAVRAAVCLAAGLAAGVLAITNWIGVLDEQAASVAADAGQYASSLEYSQRSEPLLLDPVRRIAARERALQCGESLAGIAFREWTQTPASAPPMDRWRRACDLAEQTYAEAIAVKTDIPSLTHTDVVAAHCAEWLFELNRKPQPAVAREWLRRAELAWRSQRQRTPFDVETLLALTQYRDTLRGHLGLLRDALRFGRPSGKWLERLTQLVQLPTFGRVLGDYLLGAGPITPQTDADAIIASMAPETYRLAAACDALRRDYAGAEKMAARAAELYHPLRPRFPEHEAAALAEAADYAFRASPTDPAPAIKLIGQALAALPVVQAQKLAEAALPYRCQLAEYLLIDGQVELAEETLRDALLAGDPYSQPDIEPFLLRLLRDAVASGVPRDRIEQIRTELCPRYPTLCAPASQPAADED